MGPHLRSLQLGGGLSHCAGIGARMGGLFLQREGFSVISVDIENAFNSTRYRVIYDSLRLYYPSLIPFFRFKYEHPSSMRNNAGITVASTRTGVGQVIRGAPFSSSLPSNPLFSAPRRHSRLSSGPSDSWSKRYRYRVRG